MLIESFKWPLKYHKKEQAVGTIVKKYIDINGVKQGLIIESLNQGKPLLIFLHGGPGFPAYPAVKSARLKLEQFFDVCYWDQRGTGMSYDEQDAKKPLTVEQLVDDTIDVVNYLRETYSQDKVFILGHSWGTYLGCLVASKKPELFHAYLGIGQVASMKESEQETYDYILKTAIDQNDQAGKKQIEKVAFDQVTYYRNRSYGSIRDKLTNQYGAGFIRSGYSNFAMLKDIFTSLNYRFKERLNIIIGSTYSYQSLGRVLAMTDLIELVPALDLPVYILQGQHDYRTTLTQAKRFFESIEAPYKKMFVFNHSAHSPHLEEQERFYEIIETEILEKNF